MTFTVSKSALEQFLSGCPARYTFYRKFNRVKVSAAEQFGIDVHKMVQNGIPADLSTVDLRVQETCAKLLRAVSNLGYEILAKEVEHIAPISEEIQVYGIIDAIARTPAGLPVLIDYKTSARSWNKVKTQDGEVVYPKAQGFQGPIYLTPPYPNTTSALPELEGYWPEEMHYIVAPTDGVVGVYKYYTNEKDRRNLLWAAGQLRNAAERGEFPLNRGWLCGDCPWAEACFKTPDWERHYTKREPHE